MRSLLAALFLFATTCRAQLGAELTLRTLYVEDQRDRGVALADDGISMLPKERADKLPSYNWEKDVPKRDEARRERARTLLAKTGHSAEDYYYGAFLFQHGQTADDYLFAHVLATQSIALGYSRQSGFQPQHSTATSSR